MNRAKAVETPAERDIGVAIDHGDSDLSENETADHPDQSAARRITH